MYNHKLFDSLPMRRQHDIYDRNNDIVLDIDNLLLKNFRSKSRQFPVPAKLNFNQIKAIWKYYSQFNTLREQHSRYLESLRDDASYIILFMYRITELCGHVAYSVEEDFMEENSIRKHTYDRFIDWLDGYYISDYGFPALSLLQLELFSSDDPVHLLLTIDRILNVWHGSGPLADRFIEGGIHSLSELSFSTVN